MILCHSRTNFSVTTKKEDPMSNGAIGLITGAGIGLSIMLVSMAWVIRKKSPNEVLSLRASISLLLVWFVTFAVFLGGTITLESRLGSSEGMGVLWFCGAIAELIGLIGIACAALED